MKKMNMFGKTATVDNGDGTVTITTISYKPDGTKVIKRKTQPKAPAEPKLPMNQSRAAPRTSKGGGGSGPGMLSRSASAFDLTAVKEVLQEVLGVGHADNTTFANKITRAIPAEIMLIASQDDVTQAQEDWYAMRNYNLPQTHGKAGSVATCALVQLMNENPKRFVAGTSSQPMNCLSVLQEIRKRVHNCSGLEARPVISSSRALGPPALKDTASKYKPFYIVPPNFTGKRRALLIGVVGGGIGGDLKGPPNDIHNVHQFLIKHCGFQESDITVLRDDKEAPRNCRISSKQSILSGFRNMVKQSKPKDVVFIQFSGHGGRLGDNLYLLPTDAKENGHILDDDILQDLIKYMPAQVYTTMLVDCCYSGCIGDLPYALHWNAKEGDNQAIETYYDTNTREEMVDKQSSGDKDYLAKKEARSKWKNVTKLKSVAATYAAEFARDVEKGTSVFSERAREAATAARERARERLEQSRNQQSSLNLRRSKTSEDVPPNSRASTSKPAAATEDSPSKKAPPSRPRRSRTLSPKPTPRRSKTTDESTTPPPKRTSTDERRKAAAGEGAAAAARNRTRTTPRRTKSMEDMALERELLQRRAAVEKSKREAAEAREVEQSRREAAAARAATAAAKAGNSAPERRQPPRRSKSVEDVALERELLARRRAVERSKREAAEEREVEQARKEAAASRAAEAAGKVEPKPKPRPTRRTPRRAKSMEDVAFEREVAARRAAVERSKREAAEARNTAAFRRSKTSDDVACEREDAAARKAAVERSKREAAEDAAKAEEERARKEAVERSRREAAEARQAAASQRN